MDLGLSDAISFSAEQPLKRTMLALREECDGHEIYFLTPLVLNPQASIGLAPARDGRLSGMQEVNAATSPASEPTSTKLVSTAYLSGHHEAACETVCLSRVLMRRYNLLAKVIRIFSNDSRLKAICEIEKGPWH